MLANMRGRLLAYVRDAGSGPVRGPVIDWQGGSAFVDAVTFDFGRTGTPDLLDLDLRTEEPFLGLCVLDGWVETTDGPDPDTFFEGAWRALTFDEVSRLRHGLTPWPSTG